MAELNRTYISGDSQIEGNLEVNGNAVINGDLTADNLNATGTINGASIEVTEDVKGNNIKATNSIETTSLTATGAISGATIESTGASSLNTLSSSGKSTLNSLEVTTNETIKGNLTVNGSISCADLFLKIYPIGSIYMSVNSTNPSNLFGGTWVEWGSGRVPVGIDSSDSDFSSVESTGGAKTHTLTESQLPKISGSFSLHGQESGTNIYGVSGHFSGTYMGGKYKAPNGTTAAAYSHANITYSFGGGSSHNNLQPYITCYMWKRTA